ncbi:hypothetical protein P12x_000506 [Tundrisphaera lichenicola]|uniref:hypothetical protein n=1 Tax=Tundrisphaera lichenicola TaxID=2029860 RepID=UPI003EBFBC56
MTLFQIRSTRWLVLGLAAFTGISRGDEMAPPTPIGVALPASPTWEQVLDDSVYLTQGPVGTPPNAAVPPAADSIRQGRASAVDPNNPFLSLGPAPAAPAAAQPPVTPPRMGILQMIGDTSPILAIRPAPTAQPVPTTPAPFPPNNPPPTPNPRTASALSPAVRGFKISENQSPQPQDRFFYTFNYYYNLNSAVGKRFDTPVNDLRAYRQILGFEKTFDGGRASFGLRMPIDTLYAGSPIQGNFAKPGGTSTAVGNLSFFTKFLVRQDPKTGSLLSAGLVVTPPTGPSSFAGAKFISSIQTTTIQPFVGYIFRRDRFYLHGFSAFEFPVDPADVTLAYNDVGAGYFLYQDPDPNSSKFLTAIVPTAEVHINTPLNHRNPYDPNDVAGSANVVNLTEGVSFEFRRRSILTFGVVTPVTSPKPFDIEALILFNVRFGGSRRTLPVMLGG